jgi:hypothetical protein
MTVHTEGEIRLALRRNERGGWEAWAEGKKIAGCFAIKSETTKTGSFVTMVILQNYVDIAEDTV